MSNKINKFKNEIKLWNEYDNIVKNIEKDIKNKNKKVKMYKTKQEELEVSLKEFIETNNLQKKKFNIEQTSIQYHTEIKKESMTQKFIKDSLSKYFKTYYRDKFDAISCEKKANEIFEFMSDLRKDKIKSTLKKSVI
tara:strand:+ start:1556 stop:1966 length:411 start_codon:yes stop_codon:yes gene_type:complete